MRPLVEEAGMVYVDNYPASYDAVFQVGSAVRVTVRGNK